VPGRKPAATLIALLAALALGACGSEGIDVADDDPMREGAELFAERCGGCHTLGAAGANGSANRALRNMGPNLDERVESEEDVLYAIQNGGFSGAIMPQNIVVGEEADAVDAFVAEYAGTEVDRPPSPSTLEGDEADEEGPTAE
jgi:mono/diheme cytochrome c family protein